MWPQILTTTMLAFLLQPGAARIEEQQNKTTGSTLSPKQRGNGTPSSQPAVNSTNRVSTRGTDTEPTSPIKTTVTANLFSYPRENSSKMGNDSVTGAPPAGRKSCRDVNPVKSIVYGILSVSGLVGNGISIVVLRRMSSSMTSSLLLSVLAIWDSVYLLIMLLIRVIQPIAETFFNVMKTNGPFIYAFRFVIILLGLCQLISTYTIVILTCHRYIAVCRPHHAARLCRPIVAKWQLFFVHLALVVFTLPLIFDVEIVPMQTADKTIYGYQFTSLGKDPIYQILYRSVLNSIVAFGVPLSTLTVLSILLIRAVRVANKRRASMTSVNTVAKDDITKILIAVVLVFLVCQVWRPIARITLAITGNLCGALYLTINTVNTVMLNINASINFLVYVWFGESFRRILKTMFCGLSDAKPRATQNQ